MITMLANRKISANKALLFFALKKTKEITAAI
jgi:hypothetical protein